MNSICRMWNYDPLASRQCIIWDPTEPTATRPLTLQIGANAYYYSFDQVKNVTELFDSAGLIAATYDYAPFGAVTSFQITQSGNNAITQFSNPLTFSSEIHDSTLGLQYYNYRHLNTLDGRWVNRDPIEEEGGLNLYAMTFNNSLNVNDIDGRSALVVLNIIERIAKILGLSGLTDAALNAGPAIWNQRRLANPKSFSILPEKPCESPKKLFLVMEIKTQHYMEYDLVAKIMGIPGLWWTWIGEVFENLEVKVYQCHCSCGELEEFEKPVTKKVEIDAAYIVGGGYGVKSDVKTRSVRAAKCK